MTTRVLGLRAAAAGVGSAIMTALLTWAPAGGEVTRTPAMLAGIVAVPDSSGIRIEIAFSGVFRYSLAARAAQVRIRIEGAAGHRGDYRIAMGPVSHVVVEPLHGSLPSIDITIATRRPVFVGRVSVRKYALNVHLVERGAQSGPLRTSQVVEGASESSMATASGSLFDAHFPPGKTTSRSRDMEARLEDKQGSLLAGTGRLLSVDGLVRVAVSDPRVLSVVPVSSRELLIIGRAPGRTTMYVWESRGRLQAYNIEVAPAEGRAVKLQQLLNTLIPAAHVTVVDIPGVRATYHSPVPDPQAADAMGENRPRLRLPPPAFDTSVDEPQHPQSALPGEGSASTSGGRSGSSSPAESAGFVLSGSVATQMDRLRAEEIARAFGAVVVNLLSVRHPVQLKLQVRVVELSRSALKDLGITWRVGQQAPGPTATLSGGVYDLQVINGSAPGLTAVDSVIAQIDALVQRGRARLLAEPSLVVLAGRSASLLLGGQVPIPIAGPNGAVTIEYKDFGVILRVRPEYQDDGQIFLDVTPEVSTLDFADAIKIGGLTLPSLRVRRAQTVVSMTLTQTLVIGGLLQHQDAELVQKVPVLGDLPILGPLFRSKSFQSQETDLVVFVTPTLAVPVSGKPITP
jgi:Flp pilus assembly secretin CpaC